MKKKTFEIHFGNICRIETALNFNEAMILAQAKQIQDGMNYNPDKIVLVHNGDKREIVWVKENA